MTKILLSLFLSFAFVLPLLAQVELNMGYIYARPSEQMSQNFKGVHGFSLSGGYRIPKTPFMVGLDLNLGGYGRQSERQTYTFSDGSTTETNVNVSNNIFNLMLLGRIYYPNSSMIQPYIQLRGGISNFFTNLTIEDPEDVDGCAPLESDILKSSTNFAGGVGIGTKINLGKIFSSADRFSIDFSANYTTGGQVSYMSLKRSTPQASPSSEVSADFINRHNQVVHKHHVGYVYRTPIRLIDWRLGVSFEF